MDVQLMRSARRRAGGTLSKSVPGYAGVAGLLVWHDATQVTGKSNNDPITQADDFAGSGRHATNSGGTDRPLYKTAVQNSLPAYYFDGSNDYFKSTSWQNSDASVTTFCVGSFTGSNSVSDRMWSFGSGGTSSMFYWSTTHGYYQGNGGNIDLGGTPGQWQVFTVDYAAQASVTGFRNGASIGAAWSDGGTYLASSGIVLGAQNESSFFSECYIGEFLIYDSALGSTDRHAIEVALGSKWGITIT